MQFVITRYAGVHATWTNCTHAEIVNVKEYFHKRTFLWVYYVHTNGSSVKYTSMCQSVLHMCSHM